MHDTVIGLGRELLWTTEKGLLSPFIYVHLSVESVPVAHDTSFLLLHMILQSTFANKENTEIELNHKKQSSMYESELNVTGKVVTTISSETSKKFAD